MNVGDADRSRAYRHGLARYVAHHDEAALAAGYELGREAVGDGVGLLDLACLHHEVLVEFVRHVPDADVGALTEAAAQFFLEVLATYEMTRPRTAPPTPSPTKGTSTSTSPTW